MRAKRKFAPIVLLSIMVSCFLPVVAAAETTGDCGVDNADLLVASNLQTPAHSASDMQMAVADIPLATGVWGTCSWEISSAGVLTVHPGTGGNANISGFWGRKSYWDQYENNIVRVVFASEKGKKVVAPTDSSYLLAGLEHMTSVDLSGLDTSQTTNMNGMFEYCSRLPSVDLTPLDTSKTTSMASMFSLCNALVSINLKPLNTSRVTNTSYMFNYCSSLTSIDLSPMKTSQVTNMEGMFYGCSSLTSMTFGMFDTSRVTSMSEMFRGCSKLVTLDLSCFNTSNVSDMYSMFAQCSSLVSVNLASFNTTKTTNMSQMFWQCKSLQSLDLSTFDTSSVNTTQSSFSDCDALQLVTVGVKTRMDVFPTNKFTTGNVWYSLKEKRWFSSSDITANRIGIADTYVAKSGRIENASVTLSQTTYTYDGKAKRPSAVVALDGATLVEGLDFTVQYSNNVNVGTATATVTGIGGFAGSRNAQFAIKAATAGGSGSTTTSQAMHRLYNPNSGEHFYTASVSERDYLVKVGWRYEGVGWTAPASSSTPVYRLYSGTDHHYTTSSAEKDGLVKVGWKYEGVGWYSDDAKGVALYRQFNPNVNPRAKRNNSGSHNYTTSKSENDSLVKIGWKAEGVGWYGV